MTVKVSYATDTSDPLDLMSEEELARERARQIAEARARVAAERRGEVEPRYAGKSAKEFNPNQPRDAEGRWSETPGTTVELTTDEADAVLGYASSAYDTINGYLRGGTEGVDTAIFQSEGYHDAEMTARMEEYAKHDIALIDGVIAKSPPIRMNTVYRGMFLEREPRVGDTFTDKGYVSTSSARETGEKFASYKLDPEAPLAERSAVGLVEISVPPGTPGIDFENPALHGTGEFGGDVGEFIGEREVLLDRGMTYRITDVQENVGGAVDSPGYIVKAEVVR